MSEKTVCQVLIVDDHPLMRRGIRQLLELDSTFAVVGEASSGAEAISLANRLAPDLILLDLNMKGLSGLDTLNALRRDGISARVVILTVSDARSDIFTLIDAGADGYLLKDSDPEALLQDIHQCLAGGKAFSEQYASTYITAAANGKLAIRLLSSPSANWMFYPKWLAACRISKLPAACIFQKRR